MLPLCSSQWVQMLQDQLLTGGGFVAKPVPRSWSCAVSWSPPSLIFTFFPFRCGGTQPFEGSPQAASIKRLNSTYPSLQCNLKAL